jgi:hypothetical protein
MITADNYKNWLVNDLIWIETKTNREKTHHGIILSMGLIKAGDSPDEKSLSRMIDWRW